LIFANEARLEAEATRNPTLKGYLLRKAELWETLAADLHRSWAPPDPSASKQTAAEGSFRGAPKHDA